jgi:hypothetical protein
MRSNLSCTWKGAKQVRIIIIWEKLKFIKKLINVNYIKGLIMLFSHIKKHISNPIFNPGGKLLHILLHIPQ